MEMFTASDLLTGLWLGVAAGLAVAVPLGPIGLLIIDRAMRHGRNAGLAAATGVATTDLAYATLAITATAWAARVVEPVIRPASYLAAAIIAAIAIRGLAIRVPEPAAPAGSVGSVPAGSARPGRTFVAFASLTAINPATVVYFTGLTLALADRLNSAPTRVAFLVAVGLSSLAWQAALAMLGSRLGRLPRPSVQTRTRQVGSVVLLALAALLAFRVG